MSLVTSHEPGVTSSNISLTLAMGVTNPLPLLLRRSTDPQKERNHRLKKRQYAKQQRSPEARFIFGLPVALLLITSAVDPVCSFPLSHRRVFCIHRTTSIPIASATATATASRCLQRAESTLLSVQSQSQSDLEGKENLAADELIGGLPVVQSSSLISVGQAEANTKRYGSKRRRFRNMIPWSQHGDKNSTNYGASQTGLDRLILTTAVPSMINMAVVPLVNAVDTFWVGRMGNALALAGQAAANQAFFTIFFLVSYLPTITAPRVAAAVGSGQLDQAQARVSESLFISNLLGGLGALMLVVFPMSVLSFILPVGTPAIAYAKPYLRYRGLSMLPALVASTGFAAYRGLLDTVTPLKVSLATNLFNLILDPLLIFGTPLGFVGAALATALAETLSGIVYLKLLLNRSLTTIRRMIQPPSWDSLKPLILGGASMLGRQMALNIGFVYAARRAQAMDPTGVSAAAYGIVMQLYSVGIVMHVAMQGTTAALVPMTLAKSGPDNARHVADRMFAWCSLVGVLLGATQWITLPWLVPLFTPLPAVQHAIRAPALIASWLHVVNGPIFAGEGVMLGLGCYRDLLLITAAGVGIMLAGLVSPMGQQLNGILLADLIFSVFQAVAVAGHYLKIGPLAVHKPNGDTTNKV